MSAADCFNARGNLLRSVFKVVSLFRKAFSKHAFFWPCGIQRWRVVVVVTQALFSRERSEQACEQCVMRMGADVNQACDTMRNAGKYVVQMNTTVKAP